MDIPTISQSKYQAVILGERSIGKTSFLQKLTNSGKLLQPLKSYIRKKDSNRLLTLTDKTLNISITFEVHEGDSE